MHTEKQLGRSVCDAIAYHLVHFIFISVINKCQSGIDFFLLASTQYNSSFNNKISVPSQLFRGMMKVKLWKVYAREKCQQGTRVASGKINTLERQMMGVNKYAGTFAMASFNKKTCVITEKIVVLNKYTIVFASTQSKITRLRKYQIDPKAYLGRWVCFRPPEMFVLFFVN